MARPRIPGIKLIAIRLFERDIDRAKREAKRRKVSYQAIVRNWVAEAAKR